MYDLVDRPTAELASFERAMLDSMRRWVHALSLHGAPLGDERDPLDAAMRLLDRGSADDLVIQLPCHSSVGETEAVLLGLWRLVRDARADAAHATAAMIVDTAADALVGAMRSVVQARRAM